MLTTELLGEIMRVIDRWYDNKRIRGEFQYITTKDGTTIDVLEEVQKNKDLIKSMATQAASVEWVLNQLNNGDVVGGLQTRMTSAENRITTLESNNTGIDYIAREWSRKNAANIIKNSLKDAAAHDFVKYHMLDGFVDTFTDDTGVDYPNSANITHDTTIKSIKPTPSTTLDNLFLDASTEVEKSTSNGYTFCFDYKTKRTFTVDHYGNVEIWSAGVRTLTAPTTTWSPYRQYGGAVYIPELDSLFYVGGVASNTEYAEIWQFKFSDKKWTKVVTNGAGIIAAGQYSVTYDETRRKIIWHGGVDMGYYGYYWARTQEMDIDTKTVTTYATQTGTAPGGHGAALFYLPSDGNVYLFGGLQGNTSSGTTSNNRMYLLDKTNLQWVQITYATMPPAKYRAQNLYIEGVGLLMTGGAPATASSKFIYRFDGLNWEVISISPEPFSLSKGTDAGYPAIINGYNYYYQNGSNTIFKIQLGILQVKDTVLQIKPEILNIVPDEFLLTAEFDGVVSWKLTSNNGANWYTIFPDSVLEMTDKIKGNQLILKATMMEGSELYGFGISWANDPSN